MKPRVKIGVYGASGRMGTSIIELLQRDYAEVAEVSATVDRGNGQLEDFRSVDVIIDFSLPEGTAALVDWLVSCDGKLPVLVCGTTGLNERQHSRLTDLSTSTSVMYSSNFSIGVAALSAILKFSAPLLKALAYTPRIVEAHHLHKLDAPSGTARTLCDLIEPENPGSIDVQSIREGDVIGRHDVIFAGTADRIVIGHDAMDRSLFAHGAVEVALWLCCREASSGEYTMESYLHDYFAKSTQVASLPRLGQCRNRQATIL